MVQSVALALLILDLLSPAWATDILSGIVAEALAREKQIADLLGPYKFFVYEGGAFDALSTNLLSKAKSPNEFNEYRAPIWIHRCAL